ncbi:glycine cleavage system protein GcvH [Anaeroselena agilis]|uniref:Glycine cleavage system H protein n=1 Tax=Anaeroselena agilis TaxID=3063788 RepID=A0ABU3P389_9FIRM|nr:glycine cleavage system protein GcvH [Selenomonadales bacterium 4137-cl]
MNNPQELKYSREHEWVRVEGNRATVGITDFAQHQLGDVVFVEVPTVGLAVTAGQKFSVVESVKAVSDIYTPLSGTVVAVNDALNDTPEKINEEPYGAGWIAVIEMSNPGELDALLDAAGYEKFAAEGGH